MTEPMVHERAVIVSSGDEIITGQLQDTNARWLAQRLVERGITPVEFVSLGDDARHIADTLRRAARTCTLVVMSGGLGPTEGDLTRAGLAEAIGEPLVTDEPALEALRARLAARGRTMSDLQARQAQRPASAICLPNAHGTAPGLFAVIPSARSGGSEPCEVYCLPGPPGELRPMWEQQVEPRLRTPPGRGVVTRLIHAAGLPEAECAARLVAFTVRGRSPVVNITASQSILTIRLRAEGPMDECRAAVDRTGAAIRSILGVHVFGEGDRTLAESVLEALGASGLTLTTVESCTGGLVGRLLTDVPGSSRTYIGGWVTYTDAMKRSLVGVSAEMLGRAGAVSLEVAGAMAQGGLERSGADVAVAVTGIAGPGGGTEAVPVGTVYIALAQRSRGGGAGAGVTVRRFLFPGLRAEVRERAAMAALTMLHFAVTLPDGAMPRLIWEVGEAEVPPAGSCGPRERAER